MTLFKCLEQKMATLLDKRTWGTTAEFKFCQYFFYGWANPPNSKTTNISVVIRYVKTVYPFPSLSCFSSLDDEQFCKNSGWFDCLARGSLREKQLKVGGWTIGLEHIWINYLMSFFLQSYSMLWDISQQSCGTRELHKCHDCWKRCGFCRNQGETMRVYTHVVLFSGCG